MVGDFLDVFDGQRVGLRKTRHQTRQIGARTRTQRRELCKAGVRQGHEPGDFDLDSAVHIALLGHQRAQGIEAGCVAAIQRGQGIDGGKAHGPIVGGRLRRARSERRWLSL